MNRVIPSQTFIKKYLEMGFDRHLILEAWVGCQENEANFLNTLLKIRSRDQLCSEQRLAWDGKRPLIKRIVNQTKLKKLATTTIQQRDESKEFKDLRKKGLLLKKEYRGHRGLDLEYDRQYGSSATQYIQYKADIREMKRHVRRLRYFSIKFGFYFESFSRKPRETLVPLLKSMKRNFAGLMSLKISLRNTSRFFRGDLQHFDRLFRRLGPTLKHLDLDFARANNFGANFPQVLGHIIMRNLHRLETLCLNFGYQQFPVNAIVAFFIKNVCSHMANLRKLSLQMANCIADENWSFIDPNHLENNLQSLVLNLDYCRNLSFENFFFIQHSVAVLCPSLEELYIRLPDYDIFSHFLLSEIENQLLQKLNLKKLFIERSLEEALRNYDDVLSDEMNEEETMDSLLREYMPKGLRGEEASLFWEVMMEDQEYFYCELWQPFPGEQDEMLRKLQEEKESREKKEIEEQEEAEMILHGDLTQEEWIGRNIIHEIGDLYEEEEKVPSEDDEQDHLLIELEVEQEEKKRNEIEEQEEAERVLRGEEWEAENDMMNL